MEKLSIADFFKKELKVKHNIEKLKEMQRNEKDNYSIQVEKQTNGREGLSLYYDGDKGLIAFLEDYLDLFDPNVASAQNTVIAVDGKIRDLINDMPDGPNHEKPKEKKYSVKEIRNMYAEFLRLNEKFLSVEKEINRWFELREIFKK